jgi:hypothetical protein
VADRPEDLLVLGACTRRRLGAVVHGAMLRRTVGRAVCPVVVVPPPTMARIGSPARLGRHTVTELERYLQRPAELSS